MTFPVLSLLILLPLVGALAVALVPARRRELLLPLAVTVSVFPLAAAGYLLAKFEVGTVDPAMSATQQLVDGFQFTERVLWFAPWNVSWNVGVDGISLLLVVLTTILFPIALLASKSVTHRAKSYFISMLVLETGLIGVFLALDLLLFFVFFEIVLIPMYLLIGIWGSENRRYAAIKFVLYTALGSAFMLAGIITLALLGLQQLGGINFDFRDLLALEIGSRTQILLFLAFAVAFAIKVPLFPLHTWLPDAHTEAPTAGSVLLAGVLLKLGTYGFLRFNLTLFPEASVRLAPWVAGIAVIGIIYGAVVAIVQPDVKRLVAYSSVSHLGFIVLGIFALTSQGLQGGVIQMINHGLTTGALFLLVGMIYDRRHTRMISDYGGLASVMPVYAGFFLFTVFASVGLPGLNGFIGEFKVLIGSYLTLPWHTIVAAFGVVLAAIYLLWAYERMFTGSVDKSENQGLRDLDLREVALLVPIAILIVYLGVYPKPALDRIEPSVETVLGRIVETTDYEVPGFGSVTQLAQENN